MIGRAPLQDPTSVRRTLPPLKLTHQKQRLCCSTPQHAAEAKKLAYSLGSFILADFLPQTLSVRLQPRIFERTPLYCAPPLPIGTASCKGGCFESATESPKPHGFINLTLADWQVIGTRRLQFQLVHHLVELQPHYCSNRPVCIPVAFTHTM